MKDKSLKSRLDEAKEKAEKGLKSTQISLGTSLINYIARESVQTYDYGIEYNGGGQSLTKILNSLKWKKTIANVGHKLSLWGDNQALVLEMIDGKPFIDAGDLLEYTIVGDTVTHASVSANEVVEVNGVSQPLVFVFDKVATQGIYKKKAYLLDEAIIDLKEDAIKLPFNSIPVFRLQNNVLGLPDVPRDLADAIEKMNWLSDDFIAEWIASSTQWINNMAFGSTRSADDVFNDSLNHNKIHEANDPDSKATAIAPVSLGTQSIGNLTLLINYIEDKILKYSMQFREVGAGGTNKHNLEIASQNKQAFEYMLAKLDWRQSQLTDALTNIQKLISEVIDEDAASISVVIEIPELEKFKVENMQAQVDNLKAQTDNQIGQAKSWEAQAEATKKGLTNPQPNQQLGGE